MGACFSTPAHLIEVVDGDEDAYKQRFREDKFLGEGAHEEREGERDKKTLLFVSVSNCFVPCFLTLVLFRDNR